jgi:hypothetical protein
LLKFDEVIIKEIAAKLFSMANANPNYNFTPLKTSPYNLVRDYENTQVSFIKDKSLKKAFDKNAGYADELGGVFLEGICNLHDVTQLEYTVCDNVSRNANTYTRLLDHATGLRYTEKLVYLYTENKDKIVVEYEKGVAELKTKIEESSMPSEYKELILQRIEASRDFYVDQANNIHKCISHKMASQTKSYCAHIKKNVDGYIDGDIEHEDFERDYTTFNACEALKCINLFDQHLGVYEGLNSFDSLGFFEKYIICFIS